MGVPAGTYEVRAEIIGHLAASESVVVPADGAVFVDSGCIPTALQLQEVVVTGTAFEESPVDLPYSVTVSGRRSLAEQGSRSGRLFPEPGVPARACSETGRAGTPPDRPPRCPKRWPASSPGNPGRRAAGPAERQPHVYVPYVCREAFRGRQLVPVDRSGPYRGREGGRVRHLWLGRRGGRGELPYARGLRGSRGVGGPRVPGGAGDTNVGAIWGSRLAESAHAVVSAEVAVTQALDPEDRDWALRPFTSGAAPGRIRAIPAVPFSPG